MPTPPASIILEEIEDFHLTDMHVTLKDVALHAKVSPATVSGVINKRSYCWASDETAARVMRSVEELGYRPNRGARGLRLKEFATVGLIVPDLTNPFYAALSRALTERLDALDYSVVVEDNMASLKNEAQSFDRIVDRQVDGVICSPIDASSFLEVNHRKLLHKPMVLLGAAPQDCPADSIESDFRPGLSAAIQHLIQLGHKRIAFFDGTIGGAIVDHVRQSTFSDEMKKHGLPLRPELRLTSDITLKGAFEAFNHLLESHKREDWPTAVVALNDWLAVATMGAARRHGLNIPEDLSVVGVDDIELARYLPVPLSTIAQPMDQLAEHAVQLLLDRIKGKTKSSLAREMLPMVYVSRQSTAPAREHA